MLKGRALIAALIASTLLFPGLAEGLTCFATVKQVQTTAGSRIVTTLEGDWGKEIFTVCDLTQTYGRVEVEACEAYHAYLLIAMLTGKVITLGSGPHFNHGVDPNRPGFDDLGPDTCNGWRDYQSGWPPLFNYLKGVTISR